jgi:hypothetical protein
MAYIRQPVPYQGAADAIGHPTVSPSQANPKIRAFDQRGPHRYLS